MSESYSRRDFLAGALVSGTLSAAATYLAPGGKSPVQPSSRITLRLATGGDETGARDILIGLWNQAFEHIEVQKVPGYENLKAGPQRIKMETDAINGGADILNLDTIDIRYFTDQELIREISLEDPLLFLPITRLACVAPGGGESGPYLAVPFNADVGMLFERLPAGLQGAESTTLGNVMKSESSDRFVFVGQLRPISLEDEYEGFVVNILEHALAADVGELLDANTGIPTGYEPDRWRNALTPLYEAIRSDRVVSSNAEKDSLVRFSANKTIRYMRNWPGKYRELQQSGYVDANASVIRVRPLPTGILGGQCLAIVKDSPHIAQAEQFIRFATSEPAQKILASHGLVPTRSSVYEDKDVKTVVPHLDEIHRAVGKARPRPIHARYKEFSLYLAKIMDEVLGKAWSKRAGDIELPPDFPSEMEKRLR